MKTSVKLTASSESRAEQVQVCVDCTGSPYITVRNKKIPITNTKFPMQVSLDAVYRKIVVELSIVHGLQELISIVERSKAVI